jgi:lipopolysaccharide/colanic/teichoic acid biosynthesis glycosyltransferase
MRCTCYQDFDFCCEDIFSLFLSRERKRSERSKKPIALLLIYLPVILNHDLRKKEKVVVNAVEKLTNLIRKTDVLGWFEEHHIMGVLCTEIDQAFQLTVMEKIRTVVKTVFDEEKIVSDINVRTYIFPPNELSESSEEMRVFYREETSQKKKLPLIVKRAVDIVGSLIAIVLLLPLFIIIAMVIKMGSPGPVFFKQTRVGEHGELFTFLKFRSMYANNNDSIHKEYVSRLIRGNAENNGGVFKITDDPRVTSIGKIIRRTSLDELPQFFNVLFGSMSLVGPRPPIPYETSQYDLWHFRRIMECKPGITGLWQVEGRSQTTFDGMVRMDIEYSKKQSFLLDLKLIMKTPMALLSAKGAY